MNSRFGRVIGLHGAIVLLGLLGANGAFAGGPFGKNKSAKSDDVSVCASVEVPADSKPKRGKSPVQLCNVYCEVLDCDDTGADIPACPTIKREFGKRTGEDQLPCERPDIYAVQLLTDKQSGVLGDEFVIDAVELSGQQASAEFQWFVNDVPQGTEPSLTFVPESPGPYSILLIATRPDGTQTEASAGLIVFDDGDPTPDIFGLPDKYGDVDGDGRLTLIDAHIVAKFVGRIEALPELANSLAVDFNFDGDENEEDTRLILESLLAESGLPNRLLRDSGATLASVGLVSPLLLDPETTITIEFEGSTSVQQPIRPIMGFVSFLVPNDVPVGPTNVKLLVDGSIADTYPFEKLPGMELPEDPVAEVRSFFDELRQLLEINESLVAETLDQYTLDPATRTTLLSFAKGGRLETERTLAALEELLDSPDAEVMATDFLRAGNANGLAEFRAELQAFLAEETAIAEGIITPSQLDELLLTASAVSPDEVCDRLLPNLCRVKKAAELLDRSSTIVATTCDGLLVVAALLVVIPYDAGVVGDIISIGAWTKLCLPTETALTVAGLVTLLVSNLDADVRIEASNQAPAPGESVIIKPTLEVVGFDDICSIGSAKGSSEIGKALADRAVKRLIARKKSLQAVFETLEKLNGKFAKKLRDTLTEAAGEVITDSGIDDAIRDFAGPYCDDLFGADLILPSDRVLQGPSPNVGTLQNLSDGTAEFTCPTDGSGGGSPEVRFDATKSICGSTQTKSVSVSCATTGVTITIGDNGSLNDDIFEVRVDGVSVLTSSTPVRSISTTIQLPSGSTAQVEMLGRAAPDGVGTYYIRFSGARVISGDSQSGSDLTPGRVKRFTIEVD